MRFSFLLLSMALIPLQKQGQGSFEIFSEMGEDFTVYLNQKQINAAPAARVTASDVEVGFYHIRVDFADPALPDFAKNNMSIENKMRSVFMVKMNRKGAYTMRFNGTFPIESDMAEVEVEPAPTRPVVVNAHTQGVNKQHPAFGKNTTTENVQVNISMGNAFQTLEAAANSSRTQMGETGARNSMDVSITESNTTSTSSQGWDGAPQDEPVVRVSSRPMSSSAFADYLQTIREKSFEGSKLTTAKAPLHNQHLTSEQIAQVMQAFTFEDTRIEFAIAAYNRCVDPDNYYKTHGALKYELSIEEIEEAIGH